MVDEGHASQREPNPSEEETHLSTQTHLDWRWICLLHAFMQGRSSASDHFAHVVLLLGFVGEATTRLSSWTSHALLHRYCDVVGLPTPIAHSSRTESKHCKRCRPETDADVRSNIANLILFIVQTVVQTILHIKYQRS